MIDFTSSLYLGLSHPRAALGDWSELTTGAPALLGEPLVATQLAAKIARLVGAERALMATSTLHVAWDIGELIGTMRAALFVDHSAYPILRVTADIAARRGARIHQFRGHDPDGLRNVMRNDHSAARPIVITDGFCPECRAVSPIGEYAALCAERGGLVFVDDTQALGVLGARPSAAQPYGMLGSGSVAHAGVVSSSVVTVASLAKAFGAPVATVAGPQQVIRRLESASVTRRHCSAPSRANLHAADRAMTLNDSRGDVARARLIAVVRAFRRAMSSAGARLEAGVFPIQSMVLGRREGEMLHERLRRSGVRALLSSMPNGSASARARLTFIVTTNHSAADVNAAAAIMAGATPPRRTHLDVSANGRPHASIH